MKRFLSIKYSSGAFNFALLLLRIGLGVLLLNHGYQKLLHFNEMKHHFINFIGLGSTVSLSLDIFAEFFCSIFIMLGLFTRLTVIPIVIAMSVALSKAHHFQMFGAGERAAIYLVCAIVILFCGPGKISVDGIIGK
jgi:putative oxidoreductase